jgi:uncharacterized protein (TIGR03083 family)
MTLEQPHPVLTLDLFPPERAHLLDLLRELSHDDWLRPTVCAGWSVHDVALHILGGDLANISGRRDRHRPGRSEQQPWDDLVAYLNELNQSWVAAARRISPRLVIDLLAFTGRQLYDYLATLDPHAMGAPVSWAGPQPAPVWLDIAREYTERWLHQQHIRDATGRPGLTEARFLAPVLNTFARALPHAYREVAAPAGAHLRVVVEGDAGRVWALLREDSGWSLSDDAGPAASATISIDGDTLWRLLTKGVAKNEALRRSRVEGDAGLAEPFFAAVAIIA